MGSKAIGKTDDSAKEFVIKALRGDKTHGFDLDSIYCARTADGGIQYIIFEMLKCDSNVVDPYSSDPSRYPYNWKKFVSLYQIAEKLGGKLYLVNYSDRPADKDKVKLMLVESIDFDALRKYVNTPYEFRPKYLDYIAYESKEDMTFDQFSEFCVRLMSILSWV